MAQDPTTGGYQPPLYFQPKAPSGHTVQGSVTPLRVPKPAPQNKQLPGAVRHVTVKSHVRTVPVRTPKAPTTPAVDPTTQLIDSAVRLRFGPQELGYQQRQQGEQRFQANLPGWYQQALAQIKGLQTPVNVQQAPLSAPGDAAAVSRQNLAQAFQNQQGSQQQSENNFLSNIAGGLTVQQGNLLGQSQQRQQNIGQQLAQLQGMEGDYRTTYGAQLQAGQQKNDIALANLKRNNALADYAMGITPGSPGQNRLAGQRNARTNARTTRGNLTQRQNQDAIKNAQWANNQAVKTFLLAHPELKNTKGAAVGQKLQAGVDRGSATLRLLIATPPITGTDQQGRTVTKKANPFYNLGLKEIQGHKQDFIDLLQTSGKAGHLTKEQATQAYNDFVRTHARQSLPARRELQRGKRTVKTLLKDLGVG